MAKKKYLKFKGSLFLTLIGIIGLLGFIVSSCSSSKKTNSNSTVGKDSVIVPKDTITITKYGVPPNLYDETENPPKK